MFVNDRPRAASDIRGRRFRPHKRWQTMTPTRVTQIAITAFVLGVVVGGGAVWLLPTGSPPEPLGTTAFAENQEGSAAGDPPTEFTYDPQMVTIEYEVVTDGMSVTHLSYVDVVDGVPAMVESLGTPPPFRHTFQLPQQTGIDVSDLSVTGMGAATSSTTTCTLKVNGQIVARQTADGTYGLVNCQGSGKG